MVAKAKPSARPATPKAKPNTRPVAETNRPSVTYTVLIWFGMLLALIGVAIAVLGLGDVVEFSAKVGNAQLKSTSLGLIVVAIGIFLAGFIATRMPKGVTVFATTAPTWNERIAARAGLLFLLGIVALALLGFSLWRM